MAVPTTAPESGKTAGETPLVIAAALTTVVLWASAFVGIRAAGEQLSPGPLTTGRLFIAAVVLGILVLIRREPFPPRADWPRLIAFGVLWFGVYNLALNAAERTIDAGTAAMIISITPILIAILAGFMLHEGFPRRLLVGLGIAFVGAVLIGLATANLGAAAGLGCALALVAVLAYAGGVISQKPLLGRTSPLMLTWLACVIGLVVSLPFSPDLIAELGAADLTGIGWMIYLGVFPTAIAFTTWGYALARSTAGRMSTVTYLAVPVALVMGWVILGETPPWLAVAGGALCLAGVAYSRPRGRAAAQKAETEAPRLEHSAPAVK